MSSNKINKERFSIRVSIKRLNKFRRIAANQEKTMTQMVEDWIDSLADLPQENQTS